MICPHCGSNNKEGTTFCGKCGKKMPIISDLFSPSDESSTTNKELPAKNVSPSTNNIIEEQKESFHKDNNSIQNDSETLYATANPNSIAGDTVKINTKKDTKKTDINIKSDSLPAKKKVSRIGYSTVISTPKFITKHKLYNLKIFFISLFVIPLPIVLLIFYSYSTPDFEITDAIRYGSFLSTFFVLIYVIVFLKKAYGKPWDGEITYKDSEIRERSNKGHTTTYEVFVLRIRKDSGDSDSIEEPSKNSYYYSHFNVGERIRFHPSLDYYEKYDKTNDTEILCPFCSAVTSINRNQCKKCGTPLIK